MSCDIGEVTTRLENEQSSQLQSKQSTFSNLSVALPTSQLILQPFRCLTYVTAHSTTFPAHYLRHNSFSNPSVALPTSQLILQPFRCLTYITAHSPTLLSLLLRNRRAAHGAQDEIRSHSNGLKLLEISGSAVLIWILTFYHVEYLCKLVTEIYPNSFLFKFKCCTLFWDYLLQQFSSYRVEEKAPT